MHIIPVYLTICAVIALIQLSTLYILFKNNGNLIKEIVIPDTIQFRLIKFYGEHFYIGSIIVLLISLLPIINIISIVYMFYFISPRQSELLVALEKDDTVLRMFNYKGLVYATLNDDRKIKAIFTIDAYNYLVDLDDENIKFYLGILQICLAEALEIKKYNLMVDLTDGSLSFVKVDIVE